MEDSASNAISKEQLLYSMPHKHGYTNLKKTKIRDLIMNNNVAPNNILVCDTWINLLIKIVKESTLLLTRTNYSITY